MIEKIPVKENWNFCLSFLAKITHKCPQYDFIWYSKGQDTFSYDPSITFYQSLSVSFYGNGKHLPLVPLDITSTVCFSDVLWSEVVQEQVWEVILHFNIHRVWALEKKLLLQELIRIVTFMMLQRHPLIASK